MSRKLQARGHGALSEFPSPLLRLMAAAIDVLMIVGFLALFLYFTETPPLPDPEGAGWLLLVWSSAWLVQVYFFGGTLGQCALGLGRLPESDSDRTPFLEKLAHPVLQLEKLSLGRKAQVGLFSTVLTTLVFFGVERTCLNHPLWIVAKPLSASEAKLPAALRLLGEEPTRNQSRILIWPKQEASLTLGDSQKGTLETGWTQEAKTCLTGSFLKRFSLPCLNLRSQLLAPTVLSWERELGKNLRWELSWLDIESGCALLSAQGKGRIHSACLTVGPEGGILRGIIRHPERPEILVRQANQILLGAIKRPFVE